MEFARGDILGIPYRGVRHEGLVSVDGTEDTARVIHASKRRGAVCEESVSEFMAGRPCRVIARSPHPDASIALARSMIGARWTYQDNCQAFTRRVSGLRALPSPDAPRVGFAVFAMVALAASLGHRRPRV